MALSPRRTEEDAAVRNKASIACLVCGCSVLSGRSPADCRENADAAMGAGWQVPAVARTMRNEGNGEENGKYIS